MRVTISSLLALAVIAMPVLAAEDAAPPDVANILKTIEALEKQHEQQETSLRERALQEARLAAGNPQYAVELWELAEKAARDKDQFKTWKDGEGSALDAKEVQNALRVHFNWLVLTLQRANGAKMRELLPAVIAHTKEATADHAAMEAFEEQYQRQRELAERSGNKGPRQRERHRDDMVKAMHRRISSQSVKGSPVAQMLRVGEFMGTAKKAAEGPGKLSAKEAVTGWEENPFNVEGIFQTIILRELRAQKDQRILEYWDNKLRVLAERASKSKSALEIDKFNQITRPQIQWERAVEMENVGLRNRAVSEMFAVVKAHPAHPNVENWIKDLKNRILAPAPATSASEKTATADSAVSASAPK